MPERSPGDLVCDHVFVLRCTSIHLLLSLSQFSPSRSHGERDQLCWHERIHSYTLPVHAHCSRESLSLCQLGRQEVLGFPPRWLRPCSSASRRPMLKAEQGSDGGNQRKTFSLFYEGSRPARPASCALSDCICVIVHVFILLGDSGR